MLPRQRIALCAGGLLLPMLALTGPATATDAPDPGTALPAFDGTAVDVGYVGGTVYAAFQAPGTTDTSPSVLYQTAADGTGTWQPVPDPDTGQPLTLRQMPVDDYHSFEARGPMLMVAATDETTPCPDYRLIWPDDVDQASERTFTACKGVELGIGGELLAYQVYDEAGRYWHWRVERSRTGELAGTSVARPGLVGGWVWQAEGELLGNQDGAIVAGSIPIPNDCSFRDVVSIGTRFAILDCADGPTLIDRGGELSAWPMPAQPGGQGWQLGAGVIFDQGAGTGSGYVVRVMDLAEAHTTGDYGPTRYFSLGGRAEPDDAGGPSLAYLTGDGQVGRISVSWRGTPPTAADDQTPPVIDATAGTARVVRFTSDSSDSGTPVAFSWTAHDPDHPGSWTYDVREHNSRVETYWEPRPGWTGMTGTSVTTPVVNPDTTVCFQARAHDWVGNLSSWSPSRCTFVDGGAPWVRVRSGRQVPITHLAPAPTAFWYGASDPGGIGSYEVQFRQAFPGRAFGSWVEPAAWRRTQSTISRTTVGAGVEKCFRVRARDRVGHVSGWSAQHCRSAPYDDRGFTDHGGQHWSSRAALGRTITRLHGREAITRNRVRGRTVFIRMAAETRSGLCPRVWIGTVRIDHATCGSYGDSFRYRHYQWVIVQTGRTHVGRLRIQASPYSAIRVDAVAVAR